MTQSPILIVGKNGKTGRRVDQRLKSLGYATRAVSRSTSPRFDWDDATTWRPALQGARAAYITYQPDLAVPRAEADIRAFVQAAVEAAPRPTSRLTCKRPSHPACGTRPR